MTIGSDDLQRARAPWRWRGRARPPVADRTGPGQVSVWGFSRPPQRAGDDRELIVRWGKLEVAGTRRAVKGDPGSPGC